VAGGWLGAAGGAVPLLGQGQVRAVVGVARDGEAGRGRGTSHTGEADVERHESGGGLDAPGAAVPPFSQGEGSRAGEVETERCAGRGRGAGHAGEESVLAARVGNYQFDPYWSVLIDQLWVH